MKCLLTPRANEKLNKSNEPSFHTKSKTKVLNESQTKCLFTPRAKQENK